MKITRSLVVALMAMMLLNATCQDERRPGWWPKTTPGGTGLEWPPDRPEDWPETELWPPLTEIGDNPEFWTSLWGRTIDPANDAELKRNGSFGEYRFAYNFQRIHSTDTTTKPGCKIHSIVITRSQVVPSCEPFPEAPLRQLCKDPFSKAVAERLCRENCLRNDNRCRLSRLFEPASDGKWGCYPPNPMLSDINPTTTLECTSTWICECWEN